MCLTEADALLSGQCSAPGEVRTMKVLKWQPAAHSLSAACSRYLQEVQSASAALLYVCEKDVVSQTLDKTLDL